ncbi:hypothetical protein D9M68_986670 [compost metagenome]
MCDGQSDHSEHQSSGIAALMASDDHVTLRNLVGAEGQVAPARDLVAADLDCDGAGDHGWRRCAVVRGACAERQAQSNDSQFLAESRKQ